jgi:5-methylcytosine-specific restriction endonuclease McrA
VTATQRAIAKAKRAARKARERARVERRKAKRAAKAVPRNALVAWSREIRCDGECSVCGATEHLQAHHVLPKERYQNLKLDLMNGVALCPTCHKYGKYSAHRNPMWFTLWLRAHRPEQYAWAKLNMGIPAVLGARV